MKRLFSIALLALLSFTAAAEVAPFGHVIGEATRDAVEADLGQRAKLIQGVPDDTTGEPMLIAIGDGLGIEQLDKAIFIFSKNQVLVTVMLILAKSRYADITDALKNKYELIHERNPHVGNRTAEFREDNILIFASAPHMSGNMTVAYHTDTYFLLAQQQLRRDKEAKAAREQSQL